MLFDETTLHKLNQLSLVARQVRSGVIKGERRSLKRGSSVEFADYRNYAPGDDLRRLDWNVFARLERPFIKMMEEEEDLAVYVLLDASRSMDWGEGSTNKLNYGLHLAAGLGAIALGAGDRFSFHLLQPETHAPGAQSAGNQIGPLRGSQQIMRLMAYLEQKTAQHSPAAAFDLNAALRSFGLSALRSGLVFIISDLFDPNGIQTGLNFLQGRGFEVNLLHVLCPAELDPPLSGDLRLIDIETGQPQELSLDGSMLRLYQQRLQAWQTELQKDCRQRGINYLLLNTVENWDKVILFNLRRSGLVK